MRISKLLCAVMCLSMILGSAVFSAGNDADGVKNEIPYTEERDTATSPYWYKKIGIYKGEEAASAGISFGYSGYVMKLVGDSAAGITVDFSERNIPITSVKALHMRVYYSEKVREVRVTTDAGVSWVLRHEAKKPGEWEDVILSDPNELRKLSNGDGRLGIFGFGFRCYDGTRDESVYIDEIRAELIDDDGVPPVIEYDGPDRIVTTEGKPLVLPVRAWDEGEKADFPIEYVWNKEAFDGDGLLVRGEYALTLRARDSYGNTSEKKLTVSVGERDVTPPVIEFTRNDIKTAAGAFARLDIKATDDRDDVTVEQNWSEGALDKLGRINEGVHTLTLISSDLTGNTVTVTVTVTAEKTLVK